METFNMVVGLAGGVIFAVWFGLYLFTGDSGSDRQGRPTDSELGGGE